MLYLNQGGFPEKKKKKASPSQFGDRMKGVLPFLHG